MVLCADDPLDYQQQMEQPFTLEALNLAGSERFKVHAGLLFCYFIKNIPYYHFLCQASLFYIARYDHCLYS